MLTCSFRSWNVSGVDAEELLSAAVVGATDVGWVTEVEDVPELRAVLAEVLLSRGAVQAVGGAVVARLRELGESFDDITEHTGCPRATASRWLTEFRTHRPGERKS